MDTAFARRQMVRQQVRTAEVFDDDTLDLLNELRRDEFVPEGYAELAYADTQIPLPHGQVMMTPIVEGRLLQALGLGIADRVLEIGTGYGFLTACLAKLADSVVSIDIFDDLSSAAAENLEDAGIRNAELLVMDAMTELPEGPFDAVAVTGSVAELDSRFSDLLSAGGRLFVIVGDAPLMQARLITRQAEGSLSTEVLFETSIRPLVHAERDSGFTF